MKNDYQQMINNVISIAFRIVFFLLVATNYVFFMIYKWFPEIKNNSWAYLVIFFYNLIVILMTWATIQTIYTNPGEIPFYWGFRHGDTDFQRRRYCLMCNVFKPDRCHHCSVCNKCILNMDHHCPWINTCIGFYNRKYFIQMLFYINILIIFSIFINFKFVWNDGLELYHNKKRFEFNTILKSLFLIFLYTLDFVAMIVLSMFFKFHLKLVFENKTTIETIEKKTQEYDSGFSLGSWNNFEQVMGSNKFLWFIPFASYSGQPVGNGIDWTTK